jgi:hypothetical protein
VVADLLADDRCRGILGPLDAADGALAVDDFARVVIVRERGVDPTAVDDRAVSSLREEIYQRHLPCLPPTGLVRYDRVPGTGALGADDERVRVAVE